MCIVIVKPKGYALPSTDILDNCWESNSDGAGFMFNREGKVHIVKGFMRLKHLKKAIQAYHLTEDDSIVYHFRIATAGSVKPANCHPFPASDNVKDLQATQIVTDTGIAHNGILRYKADALHDLSDTMTFIKDVLHSKLILNNFKDDAILRALEPIIGGSKLAIMDKQGDVLLYGNFIHEKGTGLYFSNDGYKKRDYSYLTFNNTWGSYKDYFDKKTTCKDAMGELWEDDITGDMPILDKCPFCNMPFTEEALYADQYCQECGSDLHELIN